MLKIWYRDHILKTWDFQTEDSESTLMLEVEIICVFVSESKSTVKTEFKAYFDFRRRQVFPGAGVGGGLVGMQFTQY